MLSAPSPVGTFVEASAGRPTAKTAPQAVATTITAPVRASATLVRRLRDPTNAFSRLLLAEDWFDIFISGNPPTESSLSGIRTQDHQLGRTGSHAGPVGIGLVLDSPSCVWRYCGASSCCCRRRCGGSHSLTQYINMYSTRPASVLHGTTRTYRASGPEQATTSDARNRLTSRSSRRITVLARLMPDSTRSDPRTNAAGVQADQRALLRHEFDSGSEVVQEQVLGRASL